MVELTNIFLFNYVSAAVSCRHLVYYTKFKAVCISLPRKLWGRVFGHINFESVEACMTIYILLYVDSIFSALQEGGVYSFSYMAIVVRP